MKGKQIWKENKIDQKRTQKRTEGTEKKQFFRKGKKEKMSDIQHLSTQSTRFGWGRIPLEVLA